MAQLKLSSLEGVVLEFKTDLCFGLLLNSGFLKYFLGVVLEFELGWCFWLVLTTTVDFDLVLI